MRFPYAHLLLWPVILAPVAPARDYYVSSTGSDGSPGTLDLPFQTIQKAAATALAGDTVYVRAGVYREAVTPARSGTETAPITFRPYNSETVTISGADVIPTNSWTNSSGNIYRAPIAWDLGEGNNQLFLVGQMMIEARWPNTTLDVSNPTVAHMTGGSYVNGTPLSVGTIADPSLPSKPENYWKGATIHMSLLNVPWDQGAGYTWQTGTVVSSTAGQLSFTWTQWVFNNWPFGPQPNVPGPKNPYYMTGKLSELDAAGEWFLDSATSTLYFWTPPGDSPAQHVVEVKHRQFAFDLSGCSFITVQGFNIFAASITSNSHSEYLVLDGLNAQYVSHYSLLPGDQAHLVGLQRDSGIILNGSNSVLRNSSIAFSAGDGVSVIGKGHRVFNNVIHDADYMGTDASPVALAYFDPLSRYLVAWNTIYNSGSQGIWDGYFNSDSADGRILHNDIYNYGLQTSDLGCTYTYRIGVQGSEIAYNWCHDSPAHSARGINFDSTVSNFIVHHNVVWNVPRSLNLSAGSSNTKLYNNTFAGTDSGLIPLLPPGQTLSLPGTELKNNIFTAPIQMTSGAVLLNNILAGTDPQFVDPTHGNFQLKPASPAIGAGLVVVPYTDGFTGKNPDAGAYDHGQPPWKAGGGHPIVTAQSAASYGVALAPDSIAFGFGPKLATGSGDAVSTTLPKSLSGTTIMVTDGVGVDRLAALVYVRPTYVAFVVPPDTAPGIALITVTSSDGTISLGSVPIFATAPALFTANSSGSGVAAGFWIRAAANGAQTFDYLFDPAKPVADRVPVPVDLGAAGDQIFLSLYGSGFRGATTSSATVGGIDVRVSGFAAVGIYQGEDVINLGPLPRSLVGRGQVEIVVTFDGKVANTVTARIR